MKKKIAAILSAAMIFVMGSTTVFAATSPVAEGVTPATLKEAVSTVTVAGETVEVGEITTSELASASQVAQTLVAGDVTSAAIVAAFDVPTGAGEATFAVNGIAAGDNVVILHWNGAEWEKITPSSVENGKVTATFGSFSPVVIVKLATETNLVVDPRTIPGWGSPQGNAAATTTATSDVVASPQTGESASILPLLAVICMAGVVVCGKKVSVANR